MRTSWVAVLALSALSAIGGDALCADSIDQSYEEVQIDEDGPDQDPVYEEDDPVYDEADDYDEQKGEAE